MESNWRYNVADFGMTWAGWKLASRLVGPLFQTLIVKETDSTWGAFSTVFLTPEGNPGRIAGPFTLTAEMRYPYGFDVDPD